VTSKGLIRLPPEPLLSSRHVFVAGADMRWTIAVIASLSSIAMTFAADDSDQKLFTALIGEGTAAVAAAAACNVDNDRILRFTAAQTALIKAMAVSMGHGDPDRLIKIRDDGFKRVREGVERQGSSAHCDVAIQAFESFEGMFRDSGAIK
jgi:hypothetical protein